MHNVFAELVYPPQSSSIFTHSPLYRGGMYFRATLCPELKPSLIPALILFELIVAYLHFRV